MLRSLLLALTLLALWSASLAAQGIRVSSDEQCSTTSASMAPPGPYTLYAVAWGGGPVTGFVGAEFRISGLPPDWTTLVSPVGDAAVSLGDPFDAPGADIAFATCQASVCRTLYEILVFPSTVETNVILTVTMRTPPTNAFLQCPLLVLCNEPVYTSVCVEGGIFCINHPGGCAVAVQRSTWSTVKALYQDARR